MSIKDLTDAMMKGKAEADLVREEHAQRRRDRNADEAAYLLAATIPKALALYSVDETEQNIKNAVNLYCALLISDAIPS